MVRKVRRYADGGKIVKDHVDDRPRRTLGSPGFTGAVKDLVNSVSMAAAPRSVAHRRARIEKGVSENDR